MAYYQNFYGQQPYNYQDQLSQLRNTPMVMPGQNQFQMQPTTQMPIQNPFIPKQTGINWVLGDAGAMAWMVAAGETAILFDRDNPVIYIKSVDANGVPSLEKYHLSKDTPPTSGDNPVFVTIEEFNGFRNEVMNKLEDLSEPVEVSVSRKGKKGAADE